MSKSRTRADQLLAQQGLAESREKAKRMIMAGEVFRHREGREPERVDKPGQLLPATTRFTVRERQRFVSRGGDKLESAVSHFQLGLEDGICLDVGASTGGFTDCLLQHGARRVYATDVGRGLLDQRLRNDPRVVVLEGVNFRYAPRDLLPEKVDLAVADCSFISLRSILPRIPAFLNPGGRILVLVKPQFELERSRVGKGVVRSTELQQEAVDGLARYAGQELGLMCLGSFPSGTKGPKGNQEHFLLLGSPE
ncbi:MAG: TlyA family RNA methyltransferase [Desulfohalobiaceae bacterium]|nr:TlyA family RNA methyltransferase [Desulfohalobiaceae bacterium]